MKTIEDRMECPHCGGKLRKHESLKHMSYTCSKCGRGWKIDKDENWHALFDASNHIYDKYGRPTEYDGMSIWEAQDDLKK